MIPPRFISKAAELGATHGLAQLHIREEGGSAVPEGQTQVEAPPLCAVALGLHFLIYEMGLLLPLLHFSLSYFL
jgi:hypothetical protein